MLISGHQGPLGLCQVCPENHCGQCLEVLGQRVTAPPPRTLRGDGGMFWGLEGPAAPFTARWVVEKVFAWVLVLQVL